jgi:hypothetical protein
LCHFTDAIEVLCREEHDTIKEYEKCVSETTYFGDIKYARKERETK